MKRTSPRSVPQTYQLAMLGAQGFPAKIWPYADSEKDWTDDEADSFMRLLDCSKDVLPNIDPDGLSLKMLRVCIAHAMGSTLPSFYLSWPLSGTTANGRVSIPKTLAYPSQESGSISSHTSRPVTLTDILEPSVPEKYLPPHAVNRAGTPVPLGGANPAHLREIVGGCQGARVYDPAGLSVTLTSGAGGFGGKTGLYAVGFNRLDGITKQIDTAYTLLASDAKGLQTNQTQTAIFHPRAVNAVHKETVRQNGRRLKNEDEPMFCLTTVDRHGVEIAGRIRRLTPREAFRLQGWDDESFDRAAAVSSDSQLYKMAGNGVTVTVTYEIGRKLKELEECEV